MPYTHKPILLGKCVEALNVKPDGIYVDCTAGCGGHSAAILEKLGQHGRLIAVDKDPQALATCKERFGGDPRVTLVHDDYCNYSRILSALGISSVDGVLADLGISSAQIDDPLRGFSYMAKDAPLDMRMDQNRGITAADVVNTYDRDKLAEIFRQYGEEEFAAKIADEIVNFRKTTKIELCGQLVEITDRAIPFAVKRKRGHSAKKVFQALRIEVNGELVGLNEALLDMAHSLSSGGRIAVLTFHSLEDRIVKRRFNDMATDCICPPGLPVCVCNHRAIGRLINKKPIVPEQDELRDNPRSASCKLRIFEKL